MASLGDQNTAAARQSIKQLLQAHPEPLSTMGTYCVGDGPRGLKPNEHCVSLPSSSTGRELGYLSQSSAIVERSSQKTNTAARSYFESDTDSDEDEPVVSRANSVRVKQPFIVHHSPSKASRAGRVSSVRSGVHRSPVTPLSERISETCETKTSADEAQHDDQQYDKLPDESVVAGGGLETAERAETCTEETETKLTLFEGLRMNPPTEKDKTSMHRAVSAPVRARTDSSSRKVKIRPSDIVTKHSKNNTRPFRETIVTTPYPDADEVDKKSAKHEFNYDETATKASNGEGTPKAKDFRGDRFPSVDQPEVLFLKLTLANHPGITTTLEIQIVNKSVYDDEQLFNHIRRSYRNQLLGMTRLPFSFIRSIAYGAASSFAQQDFEAAEFIKHLKKPRLGCGRKSWVIWLRHHSQQRSRIHVERHVAKQPLSASSRAAEKRLSVHSDTSSIFSFPFLPTSLVPRLPFLSKDSTVRPHAPVYTSPTTSASEDHRSVVEIKLNHEFSFWALASLIFCTALCSTTATIVWVLFGVPGSRPGNGREMAVWAGVLDTKSSWQTDAQARVLTGLVLGMLVAMLGAMVDLFLVAGAHVLL